eukprot:2574202-Rhodomonas_salina.5
MCRTRVIREQQQARSETCTKSSRVGGARSDRAAVNREFRKQLLVEQLHFRLVWLEHGGANRGGCDLKL